jgi:simple sugar transport system substrate-binding protein
MKDKRGMTTRRTLLQTALAAPLAPAIMPATRAAAPLGAAFVYVGPISDAGYTFQHELGRRAVDAKFGERVKTSYVENVPDNAASERVIRKLAESNGIVFATSFGFMNSTVKVAQQFPKVKFEHATGYKRAANLATYSARFYEGMYLAGVIAGRMTKSNIIGFVGAFPIPEGIQNINAFALGARLVNPKVRLKLVFVSAWFDPGKERAAADTLMGQGADVVATHTDSPAVQIAGEEKGVWTIGYNSDMARFGPKTCLTSVVTDWSGYYVERVQAVLDGKWKSQNTWGGIKDGMILLSPFNAAVPKEVADEVQARQADIVAGRLHPFQGPIADQTGAVKVAQGKTLPDAEIESMNWLAEGVEGKA